MPHPLFTLISQRPETTAIEAPAAVPKPPLADASGVADAGGGGAGVGGVHIGLDGPSVPHVAILAVLAPGSQGGAQGVTAWAPGLTTADRREILFDIEFFDVRVRRRERERERKQAEVQS